MDDQVYALAVSGATLYAGGNFDYATNTGPNAVKVSQIAKWNGIAWLVLGSEVDGEVHAVAVSGTALFAGGCFTISGGKVSAFVAKAVVAHPSGSPVILANDGNWRVRTNRFGFNVSGTVGQSVVVEGSTNLSTWLPLKTNTLGSGPLYFSDPATGAFSWRFSPGWDRESLTDAS
ncbi:MAG: hypothetical protein WCH61_10345 [bacterium]